MRHKWLCVVCPNIEPTTKLNQVPMGSHFSYSVQNTAGTINILSWGTVCPFSVWKCKQIKRRIKDVAINDKTVGVLFFNINIVKNHQFG